MPTAEGARSLFRLRLAISTAQIFCGATGVLGSGATSKGASVRDFANGAFRENATLVAPAKAAFTIWGFIYLGLALYTLWSWVPSAPVIRAIRHTGWWAAGAMALNGLWILVARAGWLELAAVVLLLLAWCLGRACVEFGRHSMPTRSSQLLVSGTFGLFLGWVTLAAVGNIAAALVARGFPATGAVATSATVAGLVLITGIGLSFAKFLPGQYAVAVGLLWGLGWIAVQRTHGTPTSLPVALAAAVAGAVIAGGFAATAPRYRRIAHHSPRGSSVSA